MSIILLLLNFLSFSPNCDSFIALHEKKPCLGEGTRTRVYNSAYGHYNGPHSGFPHHTHNSHGISNGHNIQSMRFGEHHFGQHHYGHHHFAHHGGSFGHSRAGGGVRSFGGRGGRGR